MQLKVPPKEALTILENLIKKGDELYEWMDTHYDAIKDELDKKEQASIIAFKKREQEESKKEQINNQEQTTINTLKAIAPHLLPKVEDGSLSIDEKDRQYERAIEKYQVKKRDWMEAATEAISCISGNYVLLRLFNEASWQKSSNQPYIPSLERQVDDKFDDFIYIRNNLDAKIHFFQNLYLEIEKDAKDPLYYIPERSTICWCNRVVELGSNSNQAALCKFIFQYPIGAKKEFIDAYCFITGEDEDCFERSLVVTAMGEVNKKTKKIFGFSIFRKDKQLLYICS